MSEGAVHRLHLAPSKRFPSWSSKKFLLEIINTHKNYALKREEKNKSNTEKERKKPQQPAPCLGSKLGAIWKPSDRNIPRFLWPSRCRERPLCSRASASLLPLCTSVPPAAGAAVLRRRAGCAGGRCRGPARL